MRAKVIIALVLFSATAWASGIESFTAPDTGSRWGRGLLCAPDQCLYSTGSGSYFASPTGTTDFPYDTDCVGAWAMGTANSEEEALEDRCGGDNNLTLFSNGTGTEPDVELGAAPPGAAFGAANLYLLHKPPGAEDNEGWHAADHADFEQDAFTAGCWIKPAAGAENHGFIGKYDSAVPSGWGLRTISGRLQMLVSGTAATSNIMQENGVWKHLVATYDADDGQMVTYVNGVRNCIVCGTKLGPTMANALNVSIGYNQLDVGASTEVWLHECFYIARQLTPADICEIFRAGLANDVFIPSRIATFGDCL